MLSVCAFVLMYLGVVGLLIETVCVCLLFVFVSYCVFSLSVCEGLLF